MPVELTAAAFLERLHLLQSDDELKKILRYFKSTEGERFIGVRMKHLFDLAKEFMQMAPHQIEVLLDNEIHEARAGALSIMGKQVSHKKTAESRHKELYDLYLRRHDRIDNWDLVDLAGHKVVGRYLLEYQQPRDVLYQLAESENQWERRTAIVATLYFIHEGEVDDAFRIGEMLVGDPEDLVHKATGWALRYAGDKDRTRLVEFLDRHAATMPRTLLRACLEHFEPELRMHYLKLKK